MLTSQYYFLSKPLSHSQLIILSHNAKPFTVLLDYVCKNICIFPSEHIALLSFLYTRYLYIFTYAVSLTTSKKSNKLPNLLEQNFLDSSLEIPKTVDSDHVNICRIKLCQCYRMSKIFVLNYVFPWLYRVKLKYVTICKPKYLQ
jgi:hypothetical protein